MASGGWRAPKALAGLDQGISARVHAVHEAMVVRPGSKEAPGPLRTEQPPDAEHGWSGPAPRLSAWLSRRSRSVHAAVGCRPSSTSEDACTAEITSGWRSLRIWCSGPLPGHQKRHPRASTVTSPAPLPSLRPGSIDVRTPPDYDPARQDEQLHHEKNLHAPFVYFAPVGKRLGPHWFGPVLRPRRRSGRLTLHFPRKGGSAGGPRVFTAHFRGPALTPAPGVTPGNRPARLRGELIWTGRPTRPPEGGHAASRVGSWASR